MKNLVTWKLNTHRYFINSSTILWVENKASSFVSISLTNCICQYDKAIFTKKNLLYDTIEREIHNICLHSCTFVFWFWLDNPFISWLDLESVYKKKFWLYKFCFCFLRVGDPTIFRDGLNYYIVMNKPFWMVI